ncbi:melanocortin-2 receptor accessory protein [Astyanax mexicanus]|uniref:Melanocortin-2 receptor accessory protein n=1 Tax=Astyanax mexicanus TaxID=7994 RepID=A0A8T2L050_ASTMX|nr:melanocortin-2 receptor accessory protein [Astyanax mexicanus]
MEKPSNSSAYEMTYEYYYDYMDPVMVNARSLRYNRYSIVIIFWIIMAAFIGLFFLILTNISRTGFQIRHPNIMRKGSLLLRKRERCSSSKPLV